jgi:hypothetical protein
MVTSGNENDNNDLAETQDDNANDITVETVDFPFDMPPPQFGPDSGTESASMDVGDIDGTVLYLNTLVPDSENAVVLKGFSEELVHLVTENTMVESGVFDGTAALPSAELMGFHYYIFPDDVKVYSDQALVIL